MTLIEMGQVNIMLQEAKLPPQITNQTALDINQLSSLQQTIGSYSPMQLAWASGYLAAKSENSSIAVLTPTISASASAAKTLTILFASQTGNAKGVAKQLSDSAVASGINVNLQNISDFKIKSLKSLSHLLIVASTNGEGEPPDDALSFHEFLSSKKAPKLPNLQYSVLALGDSSYEFFCQTGKDFDQRLKELGATQVTARLDCDLDYDEEADVWITSIVKDLKNTLTQDGQTESLAPVVSLATSAVVYNKQNPYAAEFSISQKLTGRDSAKHVAHVEIDLTDSGLHYQPGDALGVWFENNDKLVGQLITALGLEADVLVSLKVSGKLQKLSLQAALKTHFEITQTAPAFIDFWGKQSTNSTLLELSLDKNACREYAATHQIIDVVKSAPATIKAQDFVNALRKITPRLYSIASSQAEVDEEVHLTVGLVSYQQNDEQRLGGASGFLTQHLADGDTVKVFIEENDNFRLPQDSSTPVIMIGPGTGVAPFRAFMQEREASDATGDNWMFFGEQTFTQDFLYQVEWQNYLKSGLLTRMDVAFSRDQPEKIYVQDRMKEQAVELYAWLERGAHLYICGDGNKMAKDVHQTLIEVISEQGQISSEQAELYLKNLRDNKRYQKDVY